jgi:Peptidase_C39 like family
MKFNKIAALARTATFAAVAGALALGLASQADAATSTMYGDPTAAAKWWRHQQYDDCVLMSTADVVGQMTGKEPSERAIIEVAQSTPSTRHPGSIYVKPANKKDPNSGMGTSFMDVPQLLAHYGVASKATDTDDAARTGIPTGMAALEHFLGSGHKVVVSINAEMIWDQPIESKDRDGNPQPDHAVVVTGVDTANGVVHLNDSGTPDGRDEQIPVALFVKAWATGDNFMVVTTGTGGRSS